MIEQQTLAREVINEIQRNLVIVKANLFEKQTGEPPSENQILRIVSDIDKEFIGEA